MQLFADMLFAIRRNFERAQAARQLRGMTDHQLRDLGIERDQIESVVFAHGTGAHRATGPRAASAQIGLGARAV